MADSQTSNININPLRPFRQYSYDTYSIQVGNMSSDSDSDESISSVPATIPLATDPVEGSSKKRGRPQKADLEEYKESIIKLFSEDDVPIIDIARQLNEEHDLAISERTISRRLTAWNIPRKVRLYSL